MLSSIMHDSLIVFLIWSFTSNAQSFIPWDLSPANDDLFSQEQAVELEPFPLLDDNFDSGNEVNTDLYLADSATECLTSPFLSRSNRKLRNARRSRTDSCVNADQPSSKPNPENPLELDLGRLTVIKDIEEYWCSHLKGWAFGSVPVCNVGPRQFPSEEGLRDMDSLSLQQPSGYTTLRDCFLRKCIECVLHNWPQCCRSVCINPIPVTPFNSFLCTDEQAYCCNAFLPDKNRVSHFLMLLLTSQEKNSWSLILSLRSQMALDIGAGGPLEKRFKKSKKGAFERLTSSPLYHLSKLSNMFFLENLGSNEDFQI